MIIPMSFNISKNEEHSSANAFLRNLTCLNFSFSWQINCLHLDDDDNDDDDGDGDNDDVFNGGMAP